MTSCYVSFGICLLLSNLLVLFPRLKAFFWKFCHKIRKIGKKNIGIIIDDKYLVDFDIKICIGCDLY